MLYLWKGYTTFCGDSACETGTHLAHRGKCLTPRDMCQILSETDLALGHKRWEVTAVSESLTPEQVRDKMVAVMPAPLGELPYTFYNEVAWLHLKWTDFQGLFACSPE